MGVVGGCCTLALAHVPLIFQQRKLRLNTSMQHSMLRFGLQRDTLTPQFAFISTTFEINGKSLNICTFASFPRHFYNIVHCHVVK